ncbi:hypothetical protein [Leifsonia poae]|uniref:hypothetical protein n=1 Tax=Leifsonia poae TaxID=110933 RepID=UPI001CBBAD26|nr:hypothetical protein [Leifsonia poae]
MSTTGSEVKAASAKNGGAPESRAQIAYVAHRGRRGPSQAPSATPMSAQPVPARVSWTGLRAARLSIPAIREA